MDFMIWIGTEFGGEFDDEDAARRAARDLTLTRGEDVEVFRYRDDKDNDGEHVVTVSP